MSAMPFRCAVRSHVGLRRKLNEDAVLARTDEGLWAVSDGMGGHHAGDVASAMVVDGLSHGSLRGDAAEMACKAVAVLEDVNSRLVALADGSPDRRTIGATVVGLTVANGRYCCFWAGDSRAYHVRDGSIEQLTHDHSLVQDLVDAGMLTASEAQSHPNANVITRAVGARDFLTVDTVSGEARSGDIFVLSSDGLTRQIGQEELLSHLWGIEIEESAESLLDLALARGGADNISLIVVHVL